MTNKLERDYQRLADLGAKLGIPVPQTFISMQVKMPNGEILVDRRQRSHTYTRNAYNLLFTNMAAQNLKDATFGAGLISMKGKSATIYNLAHASILASNRGYTLTADDMTALAADDYAAGVREAAGKVRLGIAVGSGSGAEDFEGYALTTPIAHGNGSGQLVYNDTEVRHTAYVSGTKTLTDTLTRYFNNNSGGDVDVNEIGLFFGLNAGNYSSEAFLMSRDLLGVTVTIPDTGQLKVQYATSLIYPA
jgi:hypothetical protein